MDLVSNPTKNNQTKVNLVFDFRQFRKNHNQENMTQGYHQSPGPSLERNDVLKNMDDWLLSTAML